MGLVRHGKVFWLDVYINRKRIRRSLRTANRIEAIGKFQRLYEKLKEEKGGEEVRFSEFCDKYLDWAWSSKPASALREQQRLKHIQEFFNGLDIKYLSDITPYHVEQLKAKLKKDNLSKGTINRYLQILKTLFYKAIDWEVYEKANPVKKVRFYRENSHIEALTAKEMARVIQAVKEISEKPDFRSHIQKVFYDVVLLTLNTGMRKSEVLNLKWRDIKEREIEVRGKGNKRRIIPLNKTALKIIGRQPRKDEYIFYVPNRHQKDVLKGTVNQIKKRTGVNFHFHLLRHAFTTQLLEKGIDLVTIGELLGHSKISISLLYSHTDKERKRKAVDILED